MQRQVGKVSEEMTFELIFEESLGIKRAKHKVQGRGRGWEVLEAEGTAYRGSVSMGGFGFF